jgi:RimJ/RimL family protein N-acetyltransferase
MFRKAPIVPTPNTVKFGPLRREDMPMLLKWRQASPGAWRDPIATTITRQYEWFDTVVSHEHWIRGVYSVEGNFIGQTQLYPIDWYNRSAEIGVIVCAGRRQGIGTEIVNKTLTYGFRNLGLNMIWGEVYYCTDAWKFWNKICKNKVVLPQRKFWNRKYWDSLYFWWVASEWEGK